MFYWNKHYFFSFIGPTMHSSDGHSRQLLPSMKKHFKTIKIILLLNKLTSQLSSDKFLKMIMWTVLRPVIYSGHPTSSFCVFTVDSILIAWTALSNRPSHRTTLVPLFWAMSAKFSVHSNEHKTYSGQQPSVSLETIIYVHLRDNQFITAVSNHFEEKVNCPV